MLLLPASVTAREAVDTRRLLEQALKAEATNAEEVVVDASNLRHFDSSALAVLLECERAAVASGKRFVLRDLPQRLRSLARLYGVEALLLPAAATGAATNSDRGEGLAAAPS